MEDCIEYIESQGGEWEGTLTHIPPGSTMSDVALKLIGLGEEIYFIYDPVSGLEPSITFYKKINQKYVVFKFKLYDCIEMICSLPNQSAIISFITNANQQQDEE